MGMKKDIICPKCKAPNGFTTNDSGAGTKVCKLCKTKFRYECSGSKVYSSIVS